MLIAFMVALAATMPVSARAMPMATSTTGTMLQQHCPSCLQHPQASNTQPDKMLACLDLTCAGSAVVQPRRALMPGHVFRRIAYVKAPIAGWTEATPTPDPFPPRPIVLP